MHWLSAFFVFLGAWLSGFFIIATDAWMQHPVGHEVMANGVMGLRSMSELLSNPWLPWQYLHNMLGAVMTGCGFMVSVGAYYLLTGKHLEQARLFVRLGVTVGVIASFLLLFPTGDQQGKNVTEYQPQTLAAMEGLFHTERGAPLVILGQPDPESMKLDNPLVIPNVLSSLTYQRWNAEVKGLDAFPKDTWPGNVPLLYYGYHLMVGLGTIFVAVMLLSVLLLWRKSLYTNRPMLWILMLLFPFPYIANTAGWMTAEMGRQPWLVYGLIRTRDGSCATCYGR